MRHHVLIIKANGLKWLNANDSHKSIFAKRALAKEWRTMASIYARASGVPSYESAHVLALIHRRDNSLADVLNWSDTVKPIIDGLTDAGCWPNDDNEHLTVDLRPGEPWAKSGVTLIIVPTKSSRREIDSAKKIRLRRAKRRAIALRELNATIESLNNTDQKEPTNAEPKL